MKILLRQALPAVCSFAGLLLVWELLVRITDAPDYVLPAPRQVWHAGWADHSIIATHLFATLRIAVAGFMLGTALGIAVAVVITLSTVVRHATEPLLIASQAVPPVIIAPIVISVMGFGAWPKILVVAAGAFFPVAISAGVAMREADRALVDLLTSMGAGRGTILRRVRLPSSVPGIVAGAKISASYVVFTAVIAEWMGSSVGLGVYLQRSQASYRMDQLFAAVAVIAALGITLFWLSAVVGEFVLSRSRAADTARRT